MIRTATQHDADTICDIYNHYVRHTIITFEETDVAAPEMARRMDAVQKKLPWLVLETADGVAGYCYAAPWKHRSAYRFSVEGSVYVDPKAKGKGYGSQLYRALVDDLRARKLHAVIGGVALPNAASVAMQEKLGARKVAHFEQVGWKLDQWVDVGYWQLLL